MMAKERDEWATVMNAYRVISALLAQIKRCFTAGVTITVLVRRPGVPECDFIMSDDPNMDEVIATLQRRKDQKPVAMGNGRDIEVVQ